MEGGEEGGLGKGAIECSKEDTGTAFTAGEEGEGGGEGPEGRGGMVVCIHHGEGEKGGREERRGGQNPVGWANASWRPREEETHACRSLEVDGAVLSYRVLDTALSSLPC